MYRPELSGIDGQQQRFAVGWLDSSYEFSKRPASKSVHEEVVKKLRQLCRSPVRLMRGFHVCQFCETYDLDAQGYPRAQRGNGEIDVQGVDGRIYASPVMILHYIEKHGYWPPEEFVEALLQFGS